MLPVAPLSAPYTPLDANSLLAVALYLALAGLVYLVLAKPWRKTRPTRWELEDMRPH